MLSGKWRPFCLALNVLNALNVQWTLESGNEYLSKPFDMLKYLPMYVTCTPLGKSSRTFSSSVFFASYFHLND